MPFLNPSSAPPPPCRIPLLLQVLGFAASPAFGLLLHLLLLQVLDLSPLLPASCHCLLGTSIPFSVPTVRDWNKMKKGVHPQMQWISYVTQSGRLMHVMMTKIHPVGKVYHFRAKRQMAESLGQIAKFRRRFGQQNEDPNPK